ncbi:MAG: DUF4250 domain-containing protein [Lachnospiraceae bacterium]|nr:DUF4250 domain-containing protein [Lachnospiraceae bacterium]
MLPKDPAILLSFVNMKLRNEYGSLKELCDDLQVDMVDLCRQLDKIDYQYSIERNQFI